MWCSYLYSGKSLNEGRSTTQNPTVLGVWIKRRSLRPLLLRPEFIQADQTMNNETFQEQQQ